MTTTHFTRLLDASPRDAWPDEARDFTPWLFDNIDFLSDALGIELEATDTETAVGNFSADIIAKDVRTGDRVLIENQLEASDHKHLGQILTYLAGIDAKSIVWVAPVSGSASLRHPMAERTHRRRLRLFRRSFAGGTHWRQSVCPGIRGCGAT